MLGNGESTSPSNDRSFPQPTPPLPRLRVRTTHPPNVPFQPHLPRSSPRVQHGWPTSLLLVRPPRLGLLPFLKNAMVICSSARTSGHNYAFLEGPIAALTTSHDYALYSKDKTVKPTQGLRAFGRAYAAWLTSPEWFHQQLYRKMGQSPCQSGCILPRGKPASRAEMRRIYWSWRGCGRLEMWVLWGDRGIS